MSDRDPAEYCRCGKRALRSESDANRVAKTLAGKRKMNGRRYREPRPDALHAYPCDIDKKFWHVGHKSQWLKPDGGRRCTLCGEVKPARMFRPLRPEIPEVRSQQCRSCQSEPAGKRDREAAEARVLVALADNNAASAWQMAPWKPAWRLQGKGLVEVQEGRPDSHGRVTVRLTQDGLVAAAKSRGTVTG